MKKPLKKNAKRPSTKTVEEPLWSEDEWIVVRGKLRPGKGRPSKTDRLFQYVAEKLPYAALSKIRRWMQDNSDHLDGVYLAHELMGTARYGGRGQVLAVSPRTRKNTLEK